MRRTTLFRKLTLAVLPLLVAIGGLLFISVRNDLDRIDTASGDAALGEVWGHLIDAVSAIGSEQRVAVDGVAGRITLGVASAAGTPDADAFDAATTASDTALATLAGELAAHPEFGAVEMRSGTALRTARQLVRDSVDGELAVDAALNTPFAQYETVLTDLETVGALLQSATGAPTTARGILGVAQINDAVVSGARYTSSLALYEYDPANRGAIVDAKAALDEATAAYDRFVATTTTERAASFRESGITALLAGPRGNVSSAISSTSVTINVPVDVERIATASAASEALAHDLIAEVVKQAEQEADQVTTSTRVRFAIISGVALVSIAVAVLVTRSITRRVRAVADSANAVATQQLPALVGAIRDPRGRALPEIEEVSTRGSDEVSELAHSFNSLQATLRDVAEEQVAVLRRGVSDIFVTMARRNRSLVDRQLALLDEFEAEVEDPDVLASYYHLDHLATRMRRNSESLLVLANAEVRRGRVGPTEVDTVVRAAIGEIEEYRRIDVDEIDPMKLKGAAVADVAHLLAELLDNATAFSPPESVVRVGGRQVDGGGYLLRITDSGVGLTDVRLEELNDLLRNPPIIGLSVEPTLGMSVVALLANKHGIEVALVPADPGLTVDVRIPTELSADTPLPVAPAGDPLRAAEPATSFARPTDDEVIARIEADFAASPPETEPAVDPLFTARLTDAFDRADLGTPSADSSLPRRAEPGIGSSFDLPGRDRRPVGPSAPDVKVEESPMAPASATSVSSAFASFQAGQARAVAPPAAARPTLAAPLAAPRGPATSGLAAPTTGTPVPLPAPPLQAAGPSVAPLSIAPLPGLTAAGLPSRATTAPEAPTADDPQGLPSRHRGEPHYSGEVDDDRSDSTGSSPLAPEQLRARLRAFQSEFREGQYTPDPHTTQPHEEDPR